MGTREISPVLQKMRAFFLGRTHVNNLRFPQVVTVGAGHPEANLPEGPAHKLSDNRYYARDARREVNPPTLLSDGTKALGSGEGGAVGATGGAVKGPGRIYQYSDMKAGDP